MLIYLKEKAVPKKNNTYLYTYSLMFIVIICYSVLLIPFGILTDRLTVVAVYNYFVNQFIIQTIVQ